jgi:hypothetical protein
LLLIAKKEILYFLKSMALIRDKPLLKSLLRVQEEKPTIIKLLERLLHCVPSDLPIFVHDEDRDCLHVLRSG